jgi:hypothetical protein
MGTRSGAGELSAQSTRRVRLPLRVAVGVGLVAATTLALQVLLTRLFAAVLFYHYAFLAISLGLVGVGAGAILIYVRPEWFERGGVDRSLARWSAILAVLLLVVPAVLVRLDYQGNLFAGEVTAHLVLTLAATALLSALPFLAAGIVVALAVKRYVGSISRLYAFDLLGAGAGAVAVVPLLWLTDPPTLIVATGGLTGVAAALFAWPLRPWRWSGIALAACGAALVTASVGLDGRGLYGLPQATDEVAERWSPLSRVVGLPPAPTPFGTDTLYASAVYDQDIAHVPLYRPEEGYMRWRELQLGPQSIGYELTGPGDVLIIGGGGGRDVHNALSSGQRHVEVIELNRAMREMVDDDLGQWSGAPYSFPGVETEIGDGRATLAARDTDYDTIHIGFTNTLSANAASSYALTENNLYTLEAFEEYLDHLRPGGVLNVSRLYFHSGEEALRATILTLEALRRHGVSDPERNVVTILGRGIGGVFGTTLARLEPYAPQELRTIRRLARERGLGVAFAPGGPYRKEWKLLAEADSPTEFCSGYRLDVCPPTDDRPFFFNMIRLGDLGQETQGNLLARTPFQVLLITLGILAALSAVALLLPLRLVRDRGRPPLSSLLFFAAIGIGFLTLEIVLIQRFVLFLGFPTYALSVVLFSLLVFTGLGSLLAGVWSDQRRALLVGLSIAMVLIVASAIGLQDLLRALIDLPFAVRIAITVALLAPFGLTLGMAMPIGLGRLSALSPQGVPWAWGVNGLCSVLASVLAIAVAITWGFTVATLLALACYAAALAHAALGRWPLADAPSPSAERRREVPAVLRPEA